MGKLRIDNLGAIGLIEDVQSFAAQPEAWSAVVNGRMNEQGACRFLGEEKHLGTATAAWTVAGYWMMHCRTPTKDYWVNLGQQKVYVRDVGPTYTETEITRIAGVYNANENQKWNGGMMQGFLVANNGVDQPQYWPVDSAVRMLDLNNLGAGADKWPANYQCATIVPFGKYLVACNITKGGVNYPHLVKWSHPADPGSLPTSWDETNPAKDAGEYPLTDTEGIIVDAVRLGRILMIYKEDCIIKMRWVGGNYIFNFDDKVSDSQGLLAAHCATTFGRELESHFCLGQDDVYVHNGQTMNSVLKKKLRRWLFNNIDTNYYKRCFVVPNYEYSEVWLCFPEIGAEQPTLALTWNWNDDSVGIRELLRNSTGAATRTTPSTKGTPCIAVGTITDSSVEPWSDAGTWDTDTTIWDSRVFSPVMSRLIMVDRSGSKLSYRLDAGTTFDGTSYEMRLEREGLAITGRDIRGNWKVDTDSEKLVQQLWPHLEGDAGTTVYFSIGTQQAPDDPVVWSSEKAYVIGTDRFLDFYEIGKLFGIKVRAPSGNVKLQACEVDVVQVGTY